jgi:hypothetical protein
MCLSVFLSPLNPVSSTSTLLRPWMIWNSLLSDTWFVNSCVSNLPLPSHTFQNGNELHRMIERRMKGARKKKNINSKALSMELVTFSQFSKLEPSVIVLSSVLRSPWFEEVPCESYVSKDSEAVWSPEFVGSDKWWTFKTSRCRQRLVQNWRLTGSGKQPCA